MSPTEAAKNLVDKVNDIILFPTIALLSAVAVLVFLYGCFEYIFKADQSDARAAGVKHIMWGIVGLLIMLSSYAILSIAAGTFGLQGTLDNANKGLPQPNPH